MLDKKGFDSWAKDYNKSVNQCEEANEYPFAGYTKILQNVYDFINSKNANTILDIGFGTGVLTQKLYNDGYNITGIDFSSKMIEIAKNKMPKAKLLQYDFSLGLPDELSDKKYDFIISTYAIHHLANENKIIFIRELLNHLSADGYILIGDVVFETENDLEICKNVSGNNWDSDEIYIVFDYLKDNFPNAVFNKISSCSGVISIAK